MDDGWDQIRRITAMRKELADLKALNADLDKALAEQRCDCCNGMVLRGLGGKPVPCPDCGAFRTEAGVKP